MTLAKALSERMTDVTTAEVAGLTEFEGAADMFASVACFASLRCHASPGFCADQNVKETPAVIVYPPGNGAAQLVTGNLVKQEIASAIARQMNAVDRALVLTPENIEIFLKDTLRPVKMLLFSSRKTTPVILQALSSDPELWPHVRFGFMSVQGSNAVLADFK